MERVATEIPNANYTLINNAGHIANLDQPEAFNQALIKHFHNSIQIDSLNNNATVDVVKYANSRDRIQLTIELRKVEWCV